MNHLFQGSRWPWDSERWWLTEVTSLVTMHFTIVRCCWYSSCKAIDAVMKYGSNMDASLDFWSLRHFDEDPFTKAQFLRRFDATSLVRRILICSILDSAISMIQFLPQVIYKNATYRSSGWTEVGWQKKVGRDKDEETVGQGWWFDDYFDDDDDDEEEEEEGEEEEVDVTMLLLMRFWFSWHNSEPMR